MKDILRSLRNENNYSQSAVASYLNISRQMYNKYENGLAEPSLKNIKKLCELYKVSADIFFKNLKMDEDNSCSYELHSPEELCVAEPDIPYDVFNNQNNTKNLLTELINLVPLLQLSEQITLMSRLASIIESEFQISSFEKDVLFIFCGTRLDRIKCLVWEGDGFLLMYKRLQDGKFKWPRTEREAMDITQEQFEWLMKGLTVIPGVREVHPKSVC